MDSSQQLGSAIATLRKRAGLTQDDLSDKAGLSYSTLAKIEQGNIKSPSVFTILSVAVALNTSVDELLAAGATKTPKKSKQRSKEIKFIFCDVNGVLVRFFQRAFVSLADETGLNPEVIEATFWHYNEPCNKGEMTLEEFNKAMALRLGVKKVAWEDHYMKEVEPITSMHQCLIELAEDYEIGLLTNIMPGFIDAMVKKNLLPDLPYHAVVDSSVVGAAKPEAKMYETAEKMAGYQGPEILFVDDSRVNLTEAEKFGWHVLWFDDYRPKESIHRIQSVLSR